MLKKLFLFFLLVSQAQALPSVPGAVGFGTTSAHAFAEGRGTAAPTIYKITSLSNTGAGTLRECAEASGARVCVFETSGLIALTADITITNPYIWIAGQTAPYPGIFVKGGTISIEDSNVLIQHLNLMPGDSTSGDNPDSRDCINAVAPTSSTTENVIFDHITCQYSVDGCFDTFENSGGTLQNVSFLNSICANALYDSIHTSGTHSNLTLMGSNTGNISWIQSIGANARDRNGPRFNPGSQVEIINSVFYDWGPGVSNIANLDDSSAVGTAIKINAIGNYWKAGPLSSATAPLYATATAGHIGANTRLYVSHNIAPTRTSDTGTEWDVVGANISAGTYQVLSESFTGSGAEATAMTPTAAYDYVLKNAGSRPAERDAQTTKIINQIRQNNGAIINCVGPATKTADTSDCINSNGGGFPTIAVNTRSFTAVSLPNAVSGNGYTNLENQIYNDYGRIVEDTNQTGASIAKRYAARKL